MRLYSITLVRRHLSTPICLSLIVACAFFAAGCLDSGGSKKLGEGHDFGDNNPDLVLAMGDSITAGGFSGGAPWPARFGGMVGKSVINDGIAGAVAGVGAGRVQSLISSRKPGFVIIFYGANDAIQGVDVNSTDNALRAMVGAAKDAQCIPVIATCLPMSGSRVIYNGRVERINDHIRSISKEERVKLVDLHKAFRKDPDRYLAEGLHPNNEGEELIALSFLDAFN